MTYRVSGSHCLECKRLIDDASLGGRAPVPDDFALCLYCGHLAVYGADLTLREPTDDEIVMVAGHPVLLRAQNIRAEFQRKFPNKVRPRGGKR